MEQMRIQNGLLMTLVGKLDAIHKTLKSPTATKAREFYQIGCERLARGLLDKALDALQKAAELNDADFFTQFQMGKLYLYGIDDDDNVVDLGKAKAHLLEAVRYAKGEAAVDPSFLRLAGQACLHASIAVYATIENGAENGRNAELLREADALAVRAVQYDPGLAEGHYHRAKYAALLRNPDAASLLKSAIELDRDYAVKVDLDAAFDGVRHSVAQLLERLRSEARGRWEQQLSETQAAKQEALSWKPASTPALSDRLRAADETWGAAQATSRSDTYFGFLDSRVSAQQAADQFSQVAKARQTAEEEALSVALKKVSSILDSAGRIAANASQFDKAKELIDRSRWEANAKTFEAFERANCWASQAQASADDALKSTQEFNAAEHQRKEKDRRFEDACKEAPQLFLGFPILWGILSWVVLSLGSCVVRVETGNYDPAIPLSPIGVSYTLNHFLIGVGFGILVGFISFVKKL